MVLALAGCECGAAPDGDLRDGGADARVVPIDADHDAGPPSYAPRDAGSRIDPGEEPCASGIRAVAVDVLPLVAPYRGGHVHIDGRGDEVWVAQTDLVDGQHVARLTVGSATTGARRYYGHLDLPLSQTPFPRAIRPTSDGYEALWTIPPDRNALVPFASVVRFAGEEITSIAIPQPAGEWDAHLPNVDASLARCRVQCGPPELVVTQELLDLEGLHDVAWNASTLGVLTRQYQLEGAFDYALLRVDPSAGNMRASDPAEAVRSTQVLGGGLHVHDGEWIATVVRTDAIGPHFAIETSVGAARWDAEGALLWEDGALATFPETLISCSCVHLGAAFGRGARSFAALAYGDAIWAVQLGWDSGPTVSEVTRLATLPLDVPGSTPLEGALVADDGLALAGGGFGVGLERRDGFIVAGSMQDAPLMSRPSAGEPFDPPPHVEAAPDGTHFYVFRRASNTADLAASELRIEARSAAGEVRDELSIPLRHGLVPLEIASFAHDESVGVVWVDRDGGVHVLPRLDATTLASCAHDIDAPAVATLPRGLANMSAHGARSLLAAADDDGVLAIAMEPGPALTVLRLPDCEIVERR